MLRLYTGIDLIEISRLQALAPAIRARFIQRVFTMREQQLAADSDQFYAGRFAAKEAVAKALGCGIGSLSWQEIEVDRDDQSAPLLRLSGRAAARSSQLGITQWSLSITHDHSHALASAVALAEIPTEGARP